MNIEGFIRSSISFSDFFEKAKGLTNKERGDAFERVVQLHLKSKPKYASELDEVWQLNEVPKEVRKHLKLPDADEGIDLIAKHVDGTYWAIQAKYRGDPDHRLTWGEKGGLSTFTSLAFTTCINIAYGLVVSTTNRPLKKTHLTGSNVGFELYGDLLELDDDGGEGWKRLKQGLKGKPKPPKRYTPLPHQKRAIRNASKHFVKEDNARGKLIMPCGTGKSLTGFWIAKELDAKEIVVAVPSLALIKQTLNTWTREYLAHGIKPKWLAVCSDSSAGEIDAKEDRFTAELYDVGVPCVTDPKAIKKFLKEKTDQPRIIFTTYQSGQVLAKAAKSIKHIFDLCIMDEAHKTVGRKDKVFAHLVDKKNIKINRRVFMTATERFYRGNSQEIISMDDPDLYGDTFELLTFKQAIEVDDIICDYRFVTIGIAQSEITALWENNDYLRVEGTELDEDTTRSLASGLALRKAYAELGVKRAISFHKSIKLASRFKEQQEQLAEAFPELTEVDCFHVSSKTSTGERNVQLRDFADADRGLITNARCLTEGVDIPSVDCVLFADPRQSKVDIVQAAGRAMRKAKGKDHGFIIVPLVVPDDLDLETFADTTAFANVVTIIKALAAEDERIVEYLRVISTGKTIDVGDTIETEFTEVLAEKVDAAVFLENLKLKVWDKVAKLNWRPFEEAREFARSLQMSASEEWHMYSKSGNRPSDIPSAPWDIYREGGWKDIKDWLGYRSVYGQKATDPFWGDFAKARNFARSSKYRTMPEWKKAVRAGELPDAAPINPNQVYEESGWKDAADWLGVEPWAFSDAREYARSLGLSDKEEWQVHCHERKHPKGVPATPDQFYRKDGWCGYIDWLGLETERFRPFELAKKFVHKLNLGSSTEWVKYCAGKYPELGDRPSDIPSNPGKSYPPGIWTNMGDWLGTGRVADQNKVYWPFEKARKWVHKLGLKTRDEWEAYTKGGLDWLPPKPDEIPNSPNGKAYAGKWAGYRDWLGNPVPSTKGRKWRSYEEAKQFVIKLGLKDLKEWREYYKGNRPDLPPRPSDIPTSPNRAYGNLFEGLGEWLGTGVVAASKIRYRSFENAREFARGLNLSSTKDWQNYCKGEFPHLPSLPTNIPKAPHNKYPKDWVSYFDWLGNEHRSATVRWSFTEARAYCRNLSLANVYEWRKYVKGELPEKGTLPIEIPKAPDVVYAEWKGWVDWLGNENRPKRKLYSVTYEKAQAFAVELNLKSEAQWRTYLKGTSKNTHLDL